MFAAIDEEAHHLLQVDDFLQEPKATDGSFLKLIHFRLAVRPDTLFGNHSRYDFSVMYVLPALRPNECSGPCEAGATAIIPMQKWSLTEVK